MHLWKKPVFWEQFERESGLEPAPSSLVLINLEIQRKIVVLNSEGVLIIHLLSEFMWNQYLSVGFIIDIFRKKLDLKEEKSQ